MTHELPRATDDLIIQGDEAYTREEWERLERRRAEQREYHARPEVRARHAAYMRAYDKTPKRRAYKTEWQQIQRAEERRKSPDDRLVRVVASLHSIACTGPTRTTGCRCSKTFVVERLSERSLLALDPGGEQ